MRVADQIYALIKSLVGQIPMGEDYKTYLPLGSSRREAVIKKIADMVDRGEIRPKRPIKNSVLYARKVLSERLRFDRRLNKHVAYTKPRMKGHRDPALRALEKLLRLFAEDKEKLALVKDAIAKRKTELLSKQKSFPVELQPLVDKLKAG